MGLVTEAESFLNGVLRDRLLAAAPETWNFLELNAFSQMREV